MTKINENGQLEWTFEELKLVVEVLKLDKIIERNFIVFDYLSDCCGEFATGSAEWNVFNDEWFRLDKRHKVIVSVRDSIFSMLTLEEMRQVVYFRG